jgi:hypothetical protein
MRTPLALLAAALAAFGGSLASGFHFDDYAIFPCAALHSPLWNLRQTRPLSTNSGAPSRSIPATRKTTTIAASRSSPSV